VLQACILAGQADKGGKGTEVHKLAAAAILFTAEAADKVCTERFRSTAVTVLPRIPCPAFLAGFELGTLGAGTSEMRRMIIARELLMG
jgi:isovaleryl-CoA dehydrogenase